MKRFEPSQSAHTTVKHRRVTVSGVEIFYREAGPEDAPVVLLPHAYPCSSYEFRHLMPLLADKWRLLAPDFPGCGYSGTPDDFAYDFNGYAAFLEAFVAQLNVSRVVLFLHDFGSQIGLRLAIRDPRKIAGLIICNGDIYEDVLGPKYEGLKEFFRDPSDEARRKLAEAVSLEGFKEEFLNDVEPAVAERIPPDLWHLHWSLVTPRRKEISVQVIAGLKENLLWFPRYQQYLRDHQPPTLIVWGPRDGYMPEESGRAYLRDLPNAEMHMLSDAGHWILETHLSDAVALMRPFLSRLVPGD